MTLATYSTTHDKVDHRFDSLPYLDILGAVLCAIMAIGPLAAAFSLHGTY